MRTIIISRRKERDNSTPSDTVWIQCKELPELDRYIGTACRMRPDRIVIEYQDYLIRNWKEEE